MALQTRSLARQRKETENRCIPGKNFLTNGASEPPQDAATKAAFLAPQDSRQLRLRSWFAGSPQAQQSAAAQTFFSEHRQRIAASLGPRHRGRKLWQSAVWRDQSAGIPGHRAIQAATTGQTAARPLVQRATRCAGAWRWMVDHRVVHRSHARPGAPTPKAQ